MADNKNKLSWWFSAVITLGFLFILARAHFGLLAREHWGFASLRGIFMDSANQQNQNYWAKILERIRERSL